MDENKRNTSQSTEEIMAHVDRMSQLLQFGRAHGWTDDEFNHAIADLNAKFAWRYPEYTHPRGY